MLKTAGSHNFNQKRYFTFAEQNFDQKSVKKGKSKVSINLFWIF